MKPTLPRRYVRTSSRPPAVPHRLWPCQWCSPGVLRLARGCFNARRAYLGHPRFDATVEFCERYDENCFDPDYDWLPLEHFAPAVEEVFCRAPAFR